MFCAMCRPSGKSTSEIRAASKVARIISRQGKKKEIVSVMFCVGTPKQKWLVFSEVEIVYLRAYNFECYSGHHSCTFLGIRQSTVLSLTVSLRNRRSWHFIFQ